MVMQAAAKPQIVAAFSAFRFKISLRESFQILLGGRSQNRDIFKLECPTPVRYSRRRNREPECCTFPSPLSLENQACWTRAGATNAARFSDYLDSSDDGILPQRVL
jgi:hypothetical protein